MFAKSLERDVMVIEIASMLSSTMTIPKTNIAFVQVVVAVTVFSQLLHVLFFYVDFD
jgi:hypothetical protein